MIGHILAHLLEIMFLDPKNLFPKLSSVGSDKNTTMSANICTFLCISQEVRKKWAELIRLKKKGCQELPDKSCLISQEYSFL